MKILLLIFNTPKSEVLRILRNNSKIGGFAPTAKTPKLEGLRSFKNIINNIEYSKIGGSAYTQKLQNWPTCKSRVQMIDPKHLFRFWTDVQKYYNII